MVDTRRRKTNPYDDSNGYGDVPQGAVGLRGDGREYPGGYGGDAREFTGGVVDDGRGGPPDDEGFAPRFSRRRSGYGAEDLAEMASGVAHVQNNLRVEGA